MHNRFSFDPHKTDSFHSLSADRLRDEHLPADRQCGGLLAVHPNLHEPHPVAVPVLASSRLGRAVARSTCRHGRQLVHVVRPQLHAAARWQLMGLIRPLAMQDGVRVAF